LPFPPITQRDVGCDARGMQSGFTKATPNGNIVVSQKCRVVVFFLVDLVSLRQVVVLSVVLSSVLFF
jgi:hypothetical protein